MSTTSPIHPKAWQNHYTEKQAYHDSVKKAGQLLIPVSLVMALPLLYFLFYTRQLMENAPTNEMAIRYLVLVIILIVTVIIFVLFCLKYLFNVSARFLQIFHGLSVSDASKLVYLRVLGRPSLPPPLSIFFKFPTITLKDGKLDPPDHWSTIVGGPVKLIIHPGHALYLEQGSCFSRVVGQGSAFLGWNERISAVINVGPLNEEITITARTKEGIKVTVKAKGEYFLGHTRTEDEENILIPYDPESIRKAVQYTFNSGKEANEWLQSAVGQTQGILIAYISNHFLDDLFLKDHTNFTLLSSANMKDLHDTINSKLQEYGVSLSDFHISEIILPQQIKDQRFNIWQAHHTNIAVVTDGETKAYQIRMREKARAEMQRDLIFTLANGLDRIDSTNFPEPLLLSISALLDQGMKDPMVRANLAKESLETLEKMQETIKFPLQLSGK